MAVELRFKCNRVKDDYIVVDSIEHSKEVLLDIVINEAELGIYLDIPTAIKLSKKIRTEINKVKEVSNG